MLLASGDGAAGAVLLLVVMPIVQAIICWLAADALRHVPRRYRFQEPEMVWLLMVPLFNLYWNFKVFPALAESFQIAFYSHGIADVEDCGERLAHWYCICCAVGWIPCFFGLPWLIGLLLVILLLIEADKLKKRLAALRLA